MAIEVLADVITARRAPWKGSDLVMIMMLASYADPKGEHIFPSVSTLARTCRMSERNTQICLRALEADGVLVKVKGASGAPGRFTEYKIDMERVQSLQGCKVCRGAICGDDGCNPAPRRVQNPVSHIETRPRHDLDTTCAHASGPVDNPEARALKEKIEGSLNARDAHRLSGAIASLEGSSLVLEFLTELTLSRARITSPKAHEVTGMQVVYRLRSPTPAPAAA